MTNAWHDISNFDAYLTPALAVFPGRVERNIERALEIAGGPDRFRPHIKTHKMPEVIRLHLKHGVEKFKCATLSEAEMAASAGARDLLLAYQPVGPAISTLRQLTREFPQCRFSTVFDCLETANALSQAFRGEESALPVYLDLDCGMGRTGVGPGEKAEALCGQAMKLPGLKLEGVHAYDGHIHAADLELRSSVCRCVFALVESFCRKMEADGCLRLKRVFGGAPTFPIHAARGDCECSPGTYVFWDAGYGSLFKDLPFEPAAVVLTRVVSKPRTNRLCLDLGTKAVASEMRPPRVQLPRIPDAEFLGHNEEHLVLETEYAGDWKVGDELAAIPWHICPTVALYDRALVVRDGCVVDKWEISARARK